MNPNDLPVNTLVGVGQQIYQNKYNENQMRYQNQLNIAQWNRENAYNTPKAQMQRFADAGLNPNLVYGGVQQGGSLSATSPSMQTNQAASNVDLVGAMQQDRLVSAQIDNIRADTELKQTGSDYNQGLTSRIQTLMKVDEETAKNLAQSTRFLVQQGDKINAEIIEIGEKVKLLSVEEKQKNLENLFLSETFNDRVRQTASEANISEDTAYIIHATMAEEIMQAKLENKEILSRINLNNQEAKQAREIAKDYAQNLNGLHRAQKFQAFQEIPILDIQKKLLEKYGPTKEVTQIISALASAYSDVAEGTSDIIATAYTKGGSQTAKNITVTHKGGTKQSKRKR